MNGEEVEFSDDFFDLHTKSYENIINNKGVGLKDARQSIDIVHEIRKAELQPLKGDYHPLVKLPIVKHPFTNGK